MEVLVSSCSTVTLGATGVAMAAEVSMSTRSLEPRPSLRQISRVVCAWLAVAVAERCRTWSFRPKEAGVASTVPSAERKPAKRTTAAV